MSKWIPIDDKAKKIVRRTDMHEYGERLLFKDPSCHLGYPVLTGMWWQSADGEPNYRNFLGDCGNAFRPTHYQRLPK